MHLGDRRYTSNRERQADRSHRSFGDHSTAHRQAADLSTTTEAALVTLARKGEDSAVGQIVNWHGTAVLALACAILRNREQAEVVVVDVLAEACTGAGEGRPAASLRHDLARATYLRCVPRSAAAAGDSSSATEFGGFEQEDGGLDGAVALMTSLRRLARQQRAAIALVMVGDHTYLDVARLLRLPPESVIDLLVSAMRDLQMSRADDDSAGGDRASFVRRRTAPGPCPIPGRGGDEGGRQPK